ncbi:hypothetical protein WJX72_002196 [[Myrmecia] bisecta]|uniref:Uncharacterized protein n=1 Tax=[Myrmecia] bisecta TaxID=41462 RepID=A0AAW1PNK8_9CHLO
MALHPFRHIPSVSVTDQAWGSDEEDSSQECDARINHLPASRAPARGVPPHPSISAAQKQGKPGRNLSAHRPEEAQEDTLRHGVPTLQAICIGCLAPYVDELVELGAGLLQVLPPDVKGSFLAIARRGVLEDEALKLLVDEGQEWLDLAGCDRITDAALQQVLPRLANLQAVDLSRTCIGPATLRQLAACCPRVHTLRLGGTPASDDAAAAALRRIIPLVEPSAADDSWEQREEAAEQSAGRLAHLKYVLWPSVPYKASELLRLQCPKVVLNPSGRDLLQAPAVANPLIPLDQPYLDGVAQYSWPSASLDDSKAAAVPIAERFRMAYISRATRIAAQAERNWQQQRRRELRRNTAQQALTRWQDRLGHA